MTLAMMFDQMRWKVPFFLWKCWDGHLMTNESSTTNGNGFHFTLGGLLNFCPRLEMAGEF